MWKSTRNRRKRTWSSIFLNNHLKNTKKINKTKGYRRNIRYGVTSDHVMNLRSCERKKEDERMPGNLEQGRNKAQVSFWTAAVGKKILFQVFVKRGSLLQRDFFVHLVLVCVQSLAQKVRVCVPGSQSVCVWFWPSSSCGGKGETLSLSRGIKEISRE